MNGSDGSLDWLVGKRVAFLGKAGGVTKKEARQLVARLGGLPARSVDLEGEELDVDLVILGADDFPLDDADETVPRSLREAAKAGRVELLGETSFWERLGLADEDHLVRSLYTPAMLADLLEVDVAKIRQWHRMGLIRPERVIHRLPYFAYAEAASARRIHQLLESGVSADKLRKSLSEWSRFVPDADRSLNQLHVLLEGKRLLLRRGDAVFEANGQLRIDFDRTADEESAEEEEGPTLLLPDRGGSSAPTAAALEAEAQEAEDDGDYRRAVEAYRALLAAEGPNPAVNFRLADALYRAGDYAAARERYYVSIELDEDFVEARANLGCLLAELSDYEHAMAAFEGALALYPEYADVHYHLGQLLLDQGRIAEGRSHLESFLRLAPESPWADEVAELLQSRFPAAAGERG